MKAYEDFPEQKIDNGFLTLMCCMNKILENDGDNNYKIPHMSKATLERKGTLPRSIPVSTATNIMEVEQTDEEEVGEEVETEEV